MEKLDIVYLEPDLGSLFGAVALAAGGLKVLVIEKDKLKARREANLDGVELPNEPYLFRGLRSGGFLEPLFNRLKLLNKARHWVEKVDPPLQVVTPDVRVEIHSGREDMAREFSREFGLASRKALALFARFEQMAGEAYKLFADEDFPASPKSFASGFFKRRGRTVDVSPLRAGSLKSLFAEHGMGAPFSAFLRAIMSALGLSGGPETPAYLAAVTVDSMRRGLFRANTDGLSDLLIETLRARGGYTMPAAELERAEVSGREISVLRMSKSSYLQSRLFAGSAARWARYLPNEFRDDLLPPSAPSIHRLDALIEAKALPAGMKDRVAALPRTGETLLSGGALRISVSPIVKKDGADMRVLTARLTMAANDSVEDEIYAYLREIIPFIDEYTRSKKYSVQPKSATPGNGRLFLDLPDRWPIDNLLPLESELLEEMGLGAGIVSGRTLAKLILRKMGLRAEL